MSWKHFCIRTVLAALALMCAAACGGPEEPETYAPAEISSISVNGRDAVLDKQSLTFTVTLPTVTDFSSIVLSFNIFGDTVFAGDTELISGVTPVDATKP